MHSHLPIDQVLPAILQSLAAHPNLVLQAAAGAGKTTRVPPALLPLRSGGVLVLEPRRIAARLAARRVSDELGERVGETVGYQVRFEDVSGPRTRLRYLTEGVLTRRLLDDQQLRGIDTVVLDEFHERHLDADFALALLRRLQLSTRPDLSIVVMSATLDSGPVAKYLGGCPELQSHGRLFPVSIRYTAYSGKPLEEQVANAAESLKGDGDTLIFLPGAAEIWRAQRALEPICRSRNWLATPLHGDLSPEEQDAAVQPGARPKLILSTNVAESSITVEGVTTVIDSGLARVPSGLRLEVKRISQASATQRAGRAGRVGPGTAIRLYTEEDFLRRASFDTAEIHRLDLSQVLLDLRAMKIDDLEWFEDSTGRGSRECEGSLGSLGRERAMPGSFPVIPFIHAHSEIAKRSQIPRLLTVRPADWPPY